MSSADHTAGTATSGRSTGLRLVGHPQGFAIAAALGAGFLIAVPFIGLYPVFVMKLLCFALFAAALNLLLGYVGLLSFGHAAFFGMASYISAYTTQAWGLPTTLAILLGTAVAGVLGIGVGVLAVRRHGIYFAMITLALAQMVYFFCLQARFTGGEDGIQGVPRGSFLGILDLNDTLSMYYFTLGVFAIGFFIVWRTINSPFGQVLKAIRENESRVISLGYKVNHIKIAAFTLSAALAGLAGGTKAIVFQSATLTDVHWTMSGEAVLMTLLGGMGTILGPVVGAAVVVTLQNYLATVGSWVTVITGLIFVICVLLFRRGIVGEFIHRFERR